MSLRSITITITIKIKEPRTQHYLVESKQIFLTF